MVANRVDSKCTTAAATVLGGRFAVDRIGSGRIPGVAS